AGVTNVSKNTKKQRRIDTQQRFKLKAIQNVLKNGDERNGKAEVKKECFPDVRQRFSRVADERLVS
ncbi:hypothetical protein BIW11_12765, partial [Tropilaelaps mercedesae]